MHSIPSVSYLPILYHLINAYQKNFMTSLIKVSNFNTIFEILSSGKWKTTMSMEMHTVEKNQTWEIMDLPKSKKLVGCKCVFRIKYKENGTIKRYKERLYAKRLHINIWNRLLGDICTSSQNKYCESFYHYLLTLT